MKNLVVRAGQTARWTVKFNGKPAPDVFWLKEDQPITDQSGAIQIDVKKNDHTILCIPAAVRADRGKYSLKVKNPTGEDSVSADLTVLDKPGKPKGPLEVSNVTEEGCDLAWKPPDDGEFRGQETSFKSVVFQMAVCQLNIMRWKNVKRTRAVGCHVPK